jgi:hypothetical protein
MDKVAIICPYFEDAFHKREFMNRENLGIAYITSYLESKGIPVEMINAHRRRWNNELVILKNEDNIVDTPHGDSGSMPTYNLLL